MVVVDTSVWVDYLRNPQSGSGRAMDLLLFRGEVSMVGMVLSEILQGARTDSEFAALRDRLIALEFLEVTLETWIKVGEIALELRRLGSQVPLTDLTIAAVAMQHNQSVYTLDQHFQRVPGLELYEP